MPFASRRLFPLYLLLCICFAPALPAGASGPTPAAVRDFLAYTATTEARINQQHRAQNTFLGSLAPDTWSRLHGGELMVEPLSPPGGLPLPGALLHHWRGTVFAPGATAADFEALLRDVPTYPKIFGPQVVRAQVPPGQGDTLRAAMRVREHQILTVVLDTEYRVGFGRLDNRHGYSMSRSVHIAEIAAPGTAAEHALSPGEEHGFLWRQNTYWSWEERDGGVYLQLESISLSRAIPSGLGWVVRPFLETVPQESLSFTLGAVRLALRQSPEFSANPR